MSTLAIPRWAYVGLLSLFVAIMAALLPKYEAQAQAKVPETYVAGTHYEVIKEPVRTTNSDKIEVTEVFWYGCGHCNNFRPLLARWKQKIPDDVYAQHSPAIWRNNMKTHARIYYTAKVLGLIDNVHKSVFDAIHIQKKKLTSRSEIYALFEAHGISREKFDKTFKSFGVESMVNQADARARSYGTTGTPELVINGKYRISPNMVGSQRKMLEVADFLIAKERGAKS